MANQRTGKAGRDDEDEHTLDTIWTKQCQLMIDRMELEQKQAGTVSPPKSPHSHDDRRWQESQLQSPHSSPGQSSP